MASLDDILRLDELRLDGQRVLIRADLDVTLDDAAERVLNDTPLRAVLPTRSQADTETEREGQVRNRHAEFG